MVCQVLTQRLGVAPAMSNMQILGVHLTRH